MKILFGPDILKSIPKNASRYMNKVKELLIDDNLIEAQKSYDP